jgi:hypothetical protein
MDPNREGAPLEEVIMFSNVRVVPYRLAARCPPFPTIERFVHHCGRCLPIENAGSTFPFYMGAVGTMLMHRDRWAECGGYDERMIYMNGMETNMVKRLLQKYPIVDLGKLAGYDFFHLEHYHPLEPRKSSRYRKVNPHLPFSRPGTLNPNGPEWGLPELALTAQPATSKPMTPNRSVADWGGMSFVLLATRVWLAVWSDRAWCTCARWGRRVRLVREVLQGQPIARWPGLAWNLVIQKLAGA